MTISPNILSIKTIITFCCALVLSACGGGSSDSGGPPAPPLTLFTAGLYNGTLDLTLEGQNVEDAGAGPVPLTLEVQGGVAGSQQVSVAFTQFSGTSAIGPDGEFSIPSGTFPLMVTDSNDQVVSTCVGALLFEGTFVGDEVSGGVTTTTAFTCDSSEFGPLTLAGPFQATQGAAKRAGFDRDITVRALNL